MELSEKIVHSGHPLRSFDESLRTAVPALPFKVLADIKSGKSKMARPRGETSNFCEFEHLFETLMELAKCLKTLAAVHNPLLQTPAE